MKEETVSLIPKTEKAKEAIPDKEYVEKVRQEAAYRSGSVPQGVPVVEEKAGSGPVAVVMDPKNPLLSVYRELRAGIISLDECLAAVDAFVCSEENIKLLHRAPKPDKPAELYQKEADITLECAKMSDHKKAEVMKDFYAGVQEMFKDYFKRLRKWEIENLSNLHTLLDILSRVKDKNQIYASRVQAAIDTH